MTEYAWEIVERIGGVTRFLSGQKEGVIHWEVYVDTSLEGQCLT